MLYLLNVKDTEWGQEGGMKRPRFSSQDVQTAAARHDERGSAAVPISTIKPNGWWQKHPTKKKTKKTKQIQRLCSWHPIGVLPDMFHKSQHCDQWWFLGADFRKCSHLSLADDEESVSSGPLSDDVLSIFIMCLSKWTGQRSGETE